MEYFFDHYKRTYPKLQSLLTEVMSVITLLFGIGQHISNILLTKKMSKDIIEDILNKRISEIENKETKNDPNDNNMKIHTNNIININNKSSKRKYLFENSKIKIEKLVINESLKQNLKIENLNDLKINLQLMKQINYCNLIKSIFCFKDKKSKLINDCYEITNKEISIEGLLKNIYKVENAFNIILEKDENSQIRDINRKEKLNKISNSILNNVNNDNDDNDEKNEKEIYNKNNDNKSVTHLIKSDISNSEIK